MDVGAYFLSRFRRSKDSNDRDFRNLSRLRRVMGPRYLRIELARSCLVVVDAVEPDAEGLHLRTSNGLTEQQGKFGNTNP